MTPPVIYCIGTSSILEARIRSYPPAIFVQLWGRVEALIAAGRLVAPVEILHELERQDDETKRWARGQSGLFVPLDRTQTDEVTRILRSFPLLVDSSRGRSGGDPFVIALAKIRGYTVVTEEKLTRSAKRPRIPDVCLSYNVPCIAFLELVLRERWTF